MCWRKKPTVEEYHNNTALLFAVNNYPGTQNDLNGCINDQIDVEAFLKKNYPDFAIEKFKDSEVTWQSLHDQIKNHIVAMKSGDKLLICYSGHGTFGPDATEADGYREGLYPCDGKVFWDDDFKALLDLKPEGAKINIVLDSCFSGGSIATRNHGPNFKNRFMPIGDYKPKKRPRQMLKSDVMNYLLFSGSSERQTSADAYINGRYNGAFTYFWLKNWSKEKTNQEWLDATAYYLFASKFEQVPKLLGDETMKGEKFLL